MGKTNLCIGVVLGVALMMATSASAEMLTFEDLYTGVEKQGKIPSEYHGFTWQGTTSKPDAPMYITKDFNPSSYYGYQVGTFDHVSFFNGWGADVTITKDTPFTVKSAYLTSAWSDYTDSLTFKGLLNGQEVYSRAFDATKTYPSFHEFNYENIDTLIIKSWGTPVIIDNMLIENVGTVMTPEPMSTVLFTVGGVGLLGRMVQKGKRNK